MVRFVGVAPTLDWILNNAFSIRPMGNLGVPGAILPQCYALANEGVETTTAIYFDRVCRQDSLMALSASSRSR